MNYVDSKQKEDKAIGRFRRFAVNFAVRKLWLKDVKKKVVMLDYLAQILDTKTLILNCGNNFDFSINCGRNCIGQYLDLRDDICKILYGLSTCLETAVKNMTLEDSEIIRTFNCLCYLGLLKVEGMKILTWCHAKKDSKIYAKYVMIEMKFLFHLSCLIIGKSTQLQQLSNDLINNEITLLSKEQLNKHHRECLLSIKPKKMLAKELFSNLTRIDRNDPIITHNAQLETDNHKTINKETADRIKDFIHLLSLNMNFSI